MLRFLLFCAKNNAIFAILCKKQYDFAILFEKYNDFCNFYAKNVAIFFTSNMMITLLKLFVSFYCKTILEN
jgi:hypothetical protein